MSVTPRRTRSQGPAEDIDLDHPAGGAAADAKLIGVHPPTRLERELSFYGSYHHDKINQIIHFICIPAIWWSWNLIANYVTLPNSKAYIIAPGLAIQPSLGMLNDIAYMLYYLHLDLTSGAAYLPIGILIHLTTAYLKISPPDWLPLRASGYFGSDFWSPSALPFGVAVFVVGWLAQFIGHGFFEHRAPALLTNLTQALVLAPFFVHLEFLFTFFNSIVQTLAPSLSLMTDRPALRTRYEHLVAQRIKEMNRHKHR